MSSSSARHLERWPLLLAVALAAMTAGHAFELAMENAGLFGDGVAGYAHVAQGPLVVLAVALFLFAAGVLAVRLVRRARTSDGSSDWMLPALEAIGALGIRGAALRIASMQIPALLAAEFVEQRVSGIVHPSVASVFGAGHFTTPFVQFVMCAVAAWAVVAFARIVCAHARQLAKAARTVTEAFAAAPQRPTVRVVLQALLAVAASRPKRPPLLALRIANRPPPAIAAARA
ncbi:MAG TPA: hypothetical protein VII69_03625 [Candidatus Eremiobacteraceae bacterium]